MKLALVEFSTKNHYSLIYNWLSVANINHWEVILFTTKDIYTLTKDAYSNLEYEVVLYDKMNLFDFFNMKKKITVMNINKTIFLTMQSKFLEFYFSNLCSLNYGITIHNTNVWFYKNRPKKLSHYIKGFLREKIKQEASFFIVNSSNMYDSAISTDNVHMPLYIMPFSLKKQKNKTITKKKFTVVYPGMLNLERKQYTNFIRLALDNPSDEFIVLGAPAKDKKSMLVYEKMKSIDNIKTFDSFIGLNDFEKYMLEADILFSELVIDYNISDMAEKYGYTKDSGISYLMIEYKLPCLLNGNFNNLSELNESSIYFKDYYELEKQYKEIKYGNKINTLIYDMHQKLINFNINNFSTKLKELENI